MRDRRIALLGGLALLVLVVVAVQTGRGGSGGGGKRASAVAGCRVASAPRPRNPSLQPPPQTVTRGQPLRAVMATSCGSFEITLDTARAPRTVNSFVHLARRGFYDGLTFHRIAPGSIIQGGDPSGDGTGNPGYTVTERPPPNLAYTRWTVAMAKTSVEPPGTSGSQFFVVAAADAGLPPDYALLGRVTGGYGTVRRIGRLGTPSEEPRQTVLIDKVTIGKG
ncbi:MAG: peptidylprolyl isomerase [Solirubrobacterales bacterium]